MIIATAGHVDHGKTTLIRALTNIDTDRLPEEKKRGMSIDLGFAYTDLAGRRVGFIDVPGHERFIRNMLAGVAGIDFALLVIAADDGVMPQTREHLAILNLLGLQRGVVALTKNDRVDAVRIATVTHTIRDLLDETGLRDIAIIPVSVRDNTGITALRDTITDAAKQHETRKPYGNFRLSIDRVFSLRGIGITVTGTVFSGTVRTGDLLMLSPSAQKVRVRSIYTNDQPADDGSAGQRCAISITGAGGDTLNKDDIVRGEWLLAPAAHAPTVRIDARVHILKSEAQGLKHWQAVHVHAASTHTPARIALLQGSALAPGDHALAQLVLDRPIGACHADRFILRDASAKRTLGGGVVLDPFARGKGRARPERIAILNAFEKPAPAIALQDYLALSPGGIDLHRFFQTFNLSADEIDAIQAQARMRRFGHAPDVYAMDEGHYAALGLRIPAMLAQWHAQNPQSLGPNAPELLRLLQPLISILPLNAVLNQLAQSGKIIRNSTVAHLPEHRITPAVDDARAWEKLLVVYEAANLTPPRIRELAEELSQTPERTETLLSRLAQAGLLIRVSENRFFMPETLRRLAGVAEEAAAAQDGGFTAADYRLRAGIGRNLTIEVLEYFDRAGFTRRIGAARIVHSSAKDIFGE